MGGKRVADGGFIQVIPVINELGRTRLEVKVAVKSAFNDKLFALNVVIVIPMPDNTARADIHPSQGGLLYPCLGGKDGEDL